MRAESKLIRDLFEGEQCLIVPVFQRPYVWDRVRNWEPLWNDIMTVSEMFHREEKPEPHFLGAVVLDSSDKDAADISVLQVIDGQQRLTTLQVVLCAVRDAFGTAGVDGRFSKVLNKLVTNEDQLSTEDFAPYKIWPTLRDRAVFAKIVGREQADSGTDSRLLDAHQYFFEETLTWLTENGLDQSRIRGLVDALRTGLQLVVIELSEADNAQVIFESLNDRGTPLLPSDLVKNALFQQLERAGADVSQIFEEYWQRLETDFWHEDVRQGRLIRTRVDAFFAHFLTMHTGEEVLSSNLFTRFKELTSALDVTGLEQFVTEIAECSDLYRRLVQRDDSEHRSLLDTAETLDSSVLFPVVLYLSRVAAPEDRAEAFSHIESWLVRRAVLKATSKNYNRMLLELLKVLRAADSDHGSVVRHYLIGNSSESGRWPTDTEIHEAFVTAPLFKLLTRPRLRMVLRGCESGLANEDAAPRDLSGVDYAVLAERRDAVSDDVRPTLGNITLTAKSTALGRTRAWTERKEILAGSGLHLNEGLPDAISDVEIAMRSSRLADGFCKRWPHPDSRAFDTSIGDQSDEAEHDVRVPDSGDAVLQTMWAGIRDYFLPLPVGTVARLGYVKLIWPR
ncbi:Uncharacterized conserved protein (plasmid) [Tsukamurella tyrosinosolvens]|uniref:Uncharacterized conserved protein, contains ParB-like and HNH nuclease domains n=1 Tax=Tsukamurella tyrosinosolvens TaxID=57704 RepID=A0A1H4R975_TSUTY|nr:DUF262 domain-containing protein [Tsukamurella tyrosinosolvens]KXO93740.1 hypothetical protein AXK58_18310 [Tsukamurella tyrosinosolvens]SEC28358.1 Uncharacterized conserved protein, contains ParB-like and HNH nuclease domains [Tsukamurella tyrosinosolvens]VEH92212.1 Uncharacterized conserved protein [Tsukamurella tyrosinosolvens]